MPLYATRCILTGKTRWRSSRSTSSPSARPTLAARPAVRPSGPSTRSPGTRPAKRPLSDSTLLDELVPLGRPRRMPRQEIARRRFLHAGPATLDELYVPPPATGEAPDTGHLLPGRDRARALRVRRGLPPPRPAEPRQSRDPLPQPPVLQRRGRLRAGRTALYGLALKLALNLNDPCELPLSRASLRGYGQAAPEKQRDPLPWEACCLIAAWLARRDHPGDLGAARAFVVTSDGYLMPSETLALRGIDITVLRHRASLPYRKVSVTLAPFRPDDGDPVVPATEAGDYDDTVLFGNPTSWLRSSAWLHRGHARALHVLWDCPRPHLQHPSLRHGAEVQAGRHCPRSHASTLHSALSTTWRAFYRLRPLLPHPRGHPAARTLACTGLCQEVREGGSPQQAGGHTDTRPPPTG